MSKADTIYNKTISDILENGFSNEGQNVRTVWEDGTPAYTKSILNVQMVFDNGEEIPMLTSKRVPTKDPVQEGFWIWRDKSNVVQDLRNMGCTVWDEWERDDGTIGKAYGWQLANKRRKIKIDESFKQMYVNGEISGFRLCFNEDDTLDKDHIMLDQVDYLLYTLKTNPHSRRIKTTLWCVEDLDDMALEPCVYETHWQYWQEKLHLTVNIRSNDMALGNPYNIYQYAILHRMIAQVTGHEVGTICFNIDNAHAYERHIVTLSEQVNRPVYEAPIVELNQDVKSFYDFTVDDITIKNYVYDKTPTKFEVAI